MKSHGNKMTRKKARLRNFAVQDGRTHTSAEEFNLVSLKFLSSLSRYSFIPGTRTRSVNEEPNQVWRQLEVSISQRCDGLYVMYW